MRTLLSRADLKYKQQHQAIIMGVLIGIGNEMRYKNRYDKQDFSQF